MINVNFSIDLKFLLIIFIIFILFSIAMTQKEFKNIIKNDLRKLFRIMLLLFIILIFFIAIIKSVAFFFETSATSVLLNIIIWGIVILTFVGAISSKIEGIKKGGTND